MGSSRSVGPSAGALALLHDAEPTQPVLVCDGCLTVTAASGAAHAVSRAFEPGANLARSVFLTDAFPSSAVTERFGRDLAAILRATAAGRGPSLGLRTLVGELSTRSRPFAVAWAMPLVAVRSGRVDVVVDGLGLLAFAYRRVRPEPRGEESVFVLSAEDAATSRSFSSWWNTRNSGS